MSQFTESGMSTGDFELSELVCPFHDGDKDCGFKTISDEEYLDHTQIHKPVALKEEPRLWEYRLKIAKKYADKNEPKKPWTFAAHSWKNKPAKMLCSTMTSIIQDFGVTDNDNYAGLCESTGSLGFDDVPMYESVKEKPNPRRRS